MHNITVALVNVQVMTDRPRKRASLSWLCAMVWALFSRG